MFRDGSTHSYNKRADIISIINNLGVAKAFPTHLNIAICIGDRECVYFSEESGINALIMPFSNYKYTMSISSLSSFVITLKCNILSV